MREVAGRQYRLEQVRGIHGPARGGAGTDDGVNLVNEQHRAFLFLELCEHRLQALFEVAAILGAGEQAPRSSA